MSFAAYCEWVPPDWAQADLWAYRTLNSGDVELRKWSNRRALLKTIEMQNSGPWRPKFWRSWVGSLAYERLMARRNNAIGPRGVLP